MNFVSAPPTAAESTAVEGGELTSSPWSTGDRWRHSPFSCVLGFGPERHASLGTAPYPVIIPSGKADGYEAGRASSGGSGDPLEVLI